MDSLENLMPPSSPEVGLAVAAPPPPIKIVRDGILAFIASMMVTIFLVVVVIIGGLVAGAIKPSSPEAFSPTPALMLILLLAVELPLAASALFLRRRYRTTGREIPKLFEGPVGSAILRGIPVGLAVGILGILNASLSIKLFGEASSDSLRETMKLLASLRNNPVAAASLVFAIAVLAPVCEELFFRGAIYNSVRSTPKARAAAILSSILFGIAHLNLRMFPYYFIVGIAHCWLTKKTRSLASPIAAHMTINGLACVAVLLSPPSL